MPELGHLAAVVAGTAVVGGVMFSALQTVVLPRGPVTRITRFVFALADRVFESRGQWRPVPKRFSALYAPVALVSLPFAWCMLVTLGFAGILWGLDDGTFSDAFVASGSSLFTLGFAKPDGIGLTGLAFVEATIGLGLVALLISFLPTLFAAYSDRERGVGLLEPLVGPTPSAVHLLERLHLAGEVDGAAVWAPASQWFVALAQSHTAFPALCSFPSQQPGQSWVTTAGAVLDGAALRLSFANLGDARPIDPAALRHQGQPTPAVLVLARGAPAMARVARSAGLQAPEPVPLVDLIARAEDPAPAIAVTRPEYEVAVADLIASGIIEAIDPSAMDLAWGRFQWLRSGYDVAVTSLAGYTRAPAAPWSSDRAMFVGRPRFFSRRPLTTRPVP